VTHVYFFHTNNPDATLSYPHYSCPVFSSAREGKLIYGKDDATARGEYADRLRGFNRDAADAASAQCDAEGMKPSTARRIERWLCVYFGKPVRLTGIIAGVQPFNGYPWYYYQFVVLDRAEEVTP